MAERWNVVTVKDIVIVIPLLLLATSASAADVRQVILPQTVVGKQPCDGQYRLVDTWAAPQNITIRRAETWIGTTGGDPFPAVDVFTTLFIERAPSFVVSFFGLDHYVAFTGSHQLDKAFTPEQAPSVRAGETLKVQHMCNAVANIPSVSHTQVIVTYTID